MEILRRWTVWSFKYTSQNDCNKCLKFYSARPPHPQGILLCNANLDLFVPSCTQFVIQFRVVESKRLIIRRCTTSTTRSVCKSVKRDLKFSRFHDARESFIKSFLDMKMIVIIFLEILNCNLIWNIYPSIYANLINDRCNVFMTNNDNNDNRDAWT